MNEILEELRAGVDLNERQVGAVAAMLLDEASPEDLKAELLEALTAKGPTAFEIASFVEVFLERAVNPHIGLLDLDGPTLDVCGTGGDQLDLFNVSTTAMFVVAAAGAVVVKHGNRGITSKSGGADVLEELGIRIDYGADEFRHCVERAGLGFMFAPHYHPAFKAVVGVRKRLAARGVRTIFNLIGPLLNPARPQCQLVGVYDPGLCSVFAEILQRLGRESAWVVHGTTEDGRSVDEVSLMGATRICKSGAYQDPADFEVRPEDFGLRLAEVSELAGGDAKHNAEILLAILEGRDTGPRRDMVLMNAGAAIACAGLADDMGTGIEIALEMIKSGAAIAKLKLLRKAAF